MKISQSNKRLMIYLALTAVASFLGDSNVQIMRNEPLFVSKTHWFQWMCILLSVILQSVIVWRSFLDQSKYREDKDNTIPKKVKKK